ncbi:MAG: class I SAM-dependent methyltransferase [Cyanobium sp.]
MADLGLATLIEAMARDPQLWEMGHNQNLERQDLGLGWLYYGLTRSLRPSRAVVIGSWRGFVPMLLAQALQDGGADGELIFIDPSFVDDQWRGDVPAYFAAYGLHRIRHVLQTSQQFLAACPLAEQSVDLLFIDGFHSEEQCRLEFEGFSPYLTPQAMTLFHDSTSRISTTIYGADQPYTHTVWRYIDSLRQRPDLQVFDLDIAQGITLVQRRSSALQPPRAVGAPQAPMAH